MRLSFLAATIVVLTACGREVNIANLPSEPQTTPSGTPLTPSGNPVDDPDPDPDPATPGPGTPPPATPAPPTPTTNADAPIAVCSASTDILLPYHETTDFIGTASYDPNNLAIVEYRWELSERPAGSAATMPPGSDVRSGFVTDQAGLYVGRLTVVNSAGVESPACEIEIDAAPAESLWIEMSWDQNDDDMDLHLLAPGGTFNTDTDCYYANCKPSRPPLDWGVPSFADDNPILDQDDTQFMGPENINVLAPAPGNYIVAVRDFGSDPGIVSTNTTVNVYLDGQLAWTGTHTFVGDPSQPVEFVEVEWPSGVVSSLLPVPPVP